MSEMIPKRPLASLTKEECQTLFALAFGYALPLERMSVFAYAGRLNINTLSNTIILYPDGQILTLKGHGSDSHIFNARKVITQLDAYNVAFGEEFMTKPLN